LAAPVPVSGLVGVGVGVGGLVVCESVGFGVGGNRRNFSQLREPSNGAAGVRCRLEGDITVKVITRQESDNIMMVTSTGEGHVL
jgi:hypothetical protein